MTLATDDPREAIRREIRDSDLPVLIRQLQGKFPIASADILDGTIVTVDLADNSVTSAKIVDGTIVLADQSFLKRGTGTATITNGTSADSASIAHGLSGTPTSIVATARETADTRDDYVCNVVSRDATNFVMSVRGAAAEQFALANPTTVTFDWIAVL